MKNFLLKRFRIEHVYYGELIALSMCLLLVFLFALLLGLDYDSQVIEGSFLFIMILLILYAGGYIWRYGIVLMAKVCPIACGRRRCKFTGTCSLDLKMILLDIDHELPSNEQIQGLKEQVISFLDEVKFQLENSTVNTFNYFFVGSTEERFGLPFSERKNFPTVYESLCSDYDVMFCCENYTATFNQHGNTRIKLQRINERKVKHGYCQLEYRDPSLSIGYQILDSHQFLQSVHEAVRMSKVHTLSGYSRSYLCLNPIRANINAPSVKVTVYLNEELKQFEGDIVLCIKCPQWPSSSDWQLRERLWPSLEDVQRISSKGFHLVPIPLDQEGRHLPSWRYSFSVPELELSKLVPDIARKCLLAVKVILKDHLQPILPELSSYHIKTVFLNTLEKKPVSFWVEENIQECFLTILQELQHAFDTCYCDHYWLRGNLFRQFKTKHRKRLSSLAKKVKKIREDPAPFICDDGCWCICACCNCLCKKSSHRQDSQGILTNNPIDAGVVQQEAVSTNYGTFGKSSQDIV